MRRISKSTLAKYPRPLQGGVQVLGRAAGRGGTLGDEYQRALDKANAANESRYRDILSGYDALRGRVMGDLEGVGVTESQDIDRTYRNLGSDVYQRLVNRGFGNSTIPATQRMGVERERTSAQGRLAAQLARERIQADMGVSEGKMGVMERRTDEGPDVNQMIALSQAMGQGGYGQGQFAGGYPGIPIGIAPGAYQNLYQNAFMNHMGMALSPYRNGYQPIQANIRAQQRRLERYSRPPRVPTPFNYQRLVEKQRDPLAYSNQLSMAQYGV